MAKKKVTPEQVEAAERQLKNYNVRLSTTRKTIHLSCY